MTDEDDFYTTSFSTEDQEPNESTAVKNSQINKEENVYSNGEKGNIYDAVVAIKEGHANIAYKEEKEGEKKVAVKKNTKLTISTSPQAPF